jgi:hypothetical protein
VVRIQGVAANVSGRDAENRYTGGLGYLLFQSVQVSINGFGFPSGVGEYRVVDLREDPFGGKGEQGAGLNSRAQGKGTELRLI